MVFIGCVNLMSFTGLDIKFHDLNYTSTGVLFTYKKELWKNVFDSLMAKNHLCIKQIRTTF